MSPFFLLIQMDDKELSEKILEELELVSQEFLQMWLCVLYKAYQHFFNLKFGENEFSRKELQRIAEGI
ncbi:hypothetical protein SAMN02745116_02045 [Pilibacter termitis]|uniref:Uncharacterized protein n=1 Tax=Pilibacter termitis TaxID=263852 RepID=A0A1T4Q316_9ENTE|nr:hypothetical protein [Pilibacter termitis]SJZ98180.1 hypothetical protein SAMN02745116_02045 [Pilibacter termitis]